MAVLVTYASRHGSTRGIAERIADRLRAGGLDADVGPAAAVRDAKAYDAYVVGGAAYMFHWLNEATRFVERNRDLLAERPTWLFSSGPVGTDRVDKHGRNVLETTVPKEFTALRAAIHPRGEMVFFGAMDPAAKPVGAAERFLSLIPAAGNALPKGDFRDWPAIEAWADEIASDLIHDGRGRAMQPRLVSPRADTLPEPVSLLPAAQATRIKPVMATLVGIPAALIVLAAVNGERAPFVGDGTAALVTLWVLGSVMCAFGISAMRGRFGFARPQLLGMPLGLLATAFVLSGLFGWPLLLQPIVDALGGTESASLVRAATVGVGAVMIAKWTIGWLSWLPRATLVRQ